MSNTQFVHFAGKVIETTVTNRVDAADAWIRSIRRAHSGKQIIVGLDCEWRPNVISTMNNKTATLQLCVDTKCLILQLFYIDYIPHSLKDFLSDSNITFVGVEVARDVCKLLDEFGLNCASIAYVRELTLGRWPSMFFYRKPGLKDITYRLVGLDMPKPMHVCRSDWQSRVLNATQIEYASIDAYASYRIGYRLLNET